MPYPHPILKRITTSSDESDSPYSSSGAIRINHSKVHFPNHPDALSRTHLAHSPDQYDRSPISVQPNSCALPERGCPGRTYSGSSGEAAMDVENSSPVRGWPRRKGDHMHPRARITGFNTSRNDASVPPSLIQDLSDTSEDSDNNASATRPLYAKTASSISTASATSATSSQSSLRLSPKGDPAQLAFLPHPHSSPYTAERPATPYPYTSGSSTRNSRQTQRSPPSSTQQRRRSRSRVRGSPVRDRFGDRDRAARGNQDEGCLGGF
ncbi:uncharacterized protein FOMMEDRAFT_170033 [Fomitiporia mediterranea MF3/22]|uniref:uncharacterized protein n=1 Tax=Fomitiporia mediterranea (strain MF3/22) TaxID=694068 RepID=UPI0004408C6A|nr:uncharacterized protein FOMMEDRAFT_170033 [Fomitiporia mediterranea MF3/22]EJD00682.1 hypothetical protein FOMMEDRAFT_170033 [Fomitiporia mediterranea MF3/22]